MIKTKILHDNEVVEGVFEDLARRHTTVWLDIADPTVEELEMLSAHVGVSREELEELLHPHQRPILQDLGKFTAVVFLAPEAGSKTLISHSHLLLVSKEQKDFVSLETGESPALKKIAAYSVKRQAELFRKGSTALLFAALSEMVAGGFEVLDHISEQVEKLEEQVFQPRTTQKVVKQIFEVKKQLIHFQRTLAADREVISAIEKAYGQYLDAKQLSSFRLLYSDLTQLIELTATYRDITISAVEVHLSSISNNLNIVMKKLTAWAAIILVPSLIAGIYGMNFAWLPLARDPLGFWYLLSAMLVSIVLLYSYFKHQDWI